MEFIFFIFCLGSDLHVLLYFPCWNYKKKKFFLFSYPNAAAAAVGLFYMYASALRRATLGRVNPWFKSTHTCTQEQTSTTTCRGSFCTHITAHTFIHSQLQLCYMRHKSLIQRPFFLITSNTNALALFTFFLLGFSEIYGRLNSLSLWRKNIVEIQNLLHRKS